MKRVMIDSVPPGMFGSPNVMTPRLRGYYKLSTGYAELSEGTGMSHQPIYGVTVRPDPHKQSKLFQSLNSAMDYIEELS